MLVRSGKSVPFTRQGGARRRVVDAGAATRSASRMWLLAVSGLCALTVALANLISSPAIANAAATSCSAVTDYPTLVTCFANGGSVTLGGDILSTSSSDAPLVVGSTPVTLDTAGHNLTINQGTASDSPGITVASGDSLTITDSTATPGTVTVIAGGDGGDAGSAGIGAAADFGGDAPASGSVTIEGSAIVKATGAVGSAGIGGGVGADNGGDGGNVTIEGTAQVTAIGDEAAGIGGGSGVSGNGGNGGLLTVEGSATVTANGDAGAAIGGGGATGASGTGGAGGTVNISGNAQVTATYANNGTGGVGVGGGFGATVGGAGAAVTVAGNGQLKATGRYGGAGIGGGEGAGGTGGAGGSLTINTGAQVTASGSIALGGGAGPSAVTTTPTGAWGSVSNNGTLIITSGSTLTVPAGATLSNGGILSIVGTLTGSGTVQNTGVVAPNGGSIADHGDCVANDLCVATRSYALSYNVNGGSGSAPGTQYIYADSLADENTDLTTPQTLAAGPTPPSNGLFEGWYTSATTGSGTQVTANTNLVDLLGTNAGQTAATLYAHYLQVTTNPSDASVQALQSSSFSAAGSGDGSVGIQWQNCAANCSQPGSWSNIPNATSSPYTIATTHVSQSGMQYRAQFSNSFGTVTSNAATLTVSAIPQTVSFSAPASPATAGTTASPTLSGGGSGQPVVLSVDGSSAPANTCSVTNNVVSYIHVGSCVLDANQAASANGDYAAAAQVQHTVMVNAVASTVSVPTPPSTVYGQSETVTAKVSEANGASPAGTVQFSLDGHTLGSPVNVSGGSATSPQLGTLSPGSHTVTAAFTPADSTVYAGGSATATAVVNHAATSSAVAVSANAITATVSPVAPGAGTPTGTVTFEVDGTSVGTATLNNGTASFSDTLTTSSAHNVEVVYGGDANFTGSAATQTLPAGTPAASTAKPKLTAKLTSASPKSRFGFYRSAVTVRFSCAANGSTLAGACPKPVTLRANRAGQAVTRTITATDGQTSTVVVSHINIDTTKPMVRITGARNGAIISTGLPRLRCVASDRISGIASCHLRTSAVHTNARTLLTTITETATGTSRAGRTASTRITVKQLGLFIQGAHYAHGAFHVSAGRTYTVVLQGYTTQPRYVYAGPDPTGPAGGGIAFHSAGDDRWAIGVTIPQGFFTHYRVWNIGIRVGTTLHILHVAP